MHIRIMPTELTSAVENVIKKMRPLCCTGSSFVFSKGNMTSKRSILIQLGHFDMFYGYQAATNERISGYDKTLVFISPRLGSTRLRVSPITSRLEAALFPVSFFSFGAVHLITTTWA